MAACNEEYLEPSDLCDFHRRPEIGAKSAELASGFAADEEKFRRVYSFVKELPYALEDWDIPASETLAKGKGMCSGKTNLLVALLRTLGIPARYRVYRIRAEVRLWNWITGDQELATLMGDAPAEQDHVDCEVWLDTWTPCDPARDTALERGFAAMGMPLERVPVPDEATGAIYLHLASFDQWARERQQRRRISAHRHETFEKVNGVFDRIRTLGQR